MSESLTPSGMFNALTKMEERISTRMESALNRVHDRIEDSNRNASVAFKEIIEHQADHDREDAVKFATLEAKAEAAKGAGRPAWLAIISAFGTAIAAYFVKKNGG